MNKTENYILHIVSHTHWDREWYMTFQQYRRRLVKMMDLLLEILDGNPEYKSFTLDGQYIMLEDYLEIRPEKRDIIKGCIKNGRLIPGPWYTQPNEFMVSGEAMIRNLTLGLRECEKVGGGMRVCYLPDAFGHISQLPQLAKGFGINDIVAWRGIPKGAKTVFEWEGADGGVCLMFYMYGGYSNAVELPVEEEDYTEDFYFTPMGRSGLKNKIREIISSLENRTDSPHMLLMNGLDHAFPQENLPEIIEKINKKINKSEINAQAIHTDLPDYIKAVRDYYGANKINYQKFSGELRDPSESPVLSPSQSTRADVKYINSRIEGLFEKWLEPFASFAFLLGRPYPYSEIWKAWEYLLQNHSHDSLACSAVDAVYRQVLTRFEWAEELGGDIVEDTLLDICRHISFGEKNTGGNKTVAVFNPLGWKRTGIVNMTFFLPDSLGINYPELCDGEKRVPFIISKVSRQEAMLYNPSKGPSWCVPARKYEVVFKAENVPALGYKAYTLAEGRKPYYMTEKRLATGNNTIENEYILIKVNPNGVIDITDKISGKKYESMGAFEDEGDTGTGFFRVIPAGNEVISSLGCRAGISVSENTALRAAIKVKIVMNIPEYYDEPAQKRSDVLKPCEITNIITLNAGEKTVGIETRVKNLSKDHRLRVLFPTGIDTPYVFADQPFDVVRRKTALPDYNDYPEEKPSPTQPQLMFADVNDGTGGVMIANCGIYEYEVTDGSDKTIALTLLRCIERLEGGGFSINPDKKIPGGQCIGEYNFKYAVILHEGGWENAYKSAYDFRFPMKSVFGRPLEEESLASYKSGITSELPAETSFTEISPESGDILVSAIKKHEINNSVIARLFNPTDKQKQAKIRINLPEKIFKAHYVNLEEKRTGEPRIETDPEGWISVDMRPKEIKTLEFEL